jgi:apolipoprotein N-acyltransferase
VVWPESALTFFLEDEQAYRAYLGALLERVRGQLVTGGPRVARSGDGRSTVYHNAAFLVTSNGAIGAVYEKQFLVPFAEYFPWPRLDFLRREFGRVREFAPGADPVLLPSVAGPLGVMICNEAMLGENAIDRVRSGAEVLVALANDSWVGELQYADIALEMTRLRAVEVRRWLVRSSTSGPSAIVDPVGRLVDERGFGRAGTVQGDVVARHGLTVYARIGDAFAWGAAVVVAIALVVTRRTAPGPV